MGERVVGEHDGLNPTRWPKSRLKTVASIRVSNVDKKSVEGEQPVQLCNYTDVYYRDRIDATVDFMWATAPEHQARAFRLQVGDVLITKDSESWDDIAVPAVVSEPVDAVCGYHLALLRPMLGKLDGRFLGYSMMSGPTSAHFKVEANGVTRYAIGLRAIGDAPIKAPELAVQVAVADYLDAETASLDALIEHKERFIELLQEKRTALITRAVTKGLDPDAEMKQSGVEWIGDVPAHWQVVRTKHVARLESGHTPSRQHPEYWLDCTVPWVTTSEVWQVRDGRVEYITDTTEKVSELGLANSSARMLPAGTVVLSRTASVGFSAIMPCAMATSQDFADWVPGSNLISEYLLYTFRSMRSEFDRLMMGSTHKTIYMPDIQKFSMPLPHLEEQRRIVAYVRRETGRLDTLIDKTRRSIELLKEYRTALISAAVTGQIDILRNRNTGGTA